VGGGKGGDFGGGVIIKKKKKINKKKLYVQKIKLHLYFTGGNFQLQP